METATITQVKNGLSAYIDKVKAGESILVTDRGVPVAVLEPVTEQVDWTSGWRVSSEQDSSGAARAGSRSRSSGRRDRSCARPGTRSWTR